MATRKYEKRVRAQGEDETRRRITEAAVALHGTVGPARTTISAIAERAGVQRLTVYRHFPDEAAILQACSQHWMAQHPPPDPSAWTGLAPGRARLEGALRAFYGYYRATGEMLANVLRDAALVPALAAQAEGYEQALAGLRDALAQDWCTDGERRLLVAAVIGHGLHFYTWRSLTQEQELSDVQAAQLMAELVECAVGLVAPGRQPDDDSYANGE